MCYRYSQSQWGVNKTNDYKTRSSNHRENFPVRIGNVCFFIFLHEPNRQSGRLDCLFGCLDTLSVAFKTIFGHPCCQSGCLNFLSDCLDSLISMPAHLPESACPKILFPEWFRPKLFYPKTFARVLLYPENIINYVFG